MSSCTELECDKYMAIKHIIKKNASQYLMLTAVEWADVSIKFLNSEFLSQKKGYLLPPDLIVQSLTRNCIEQAFHTIDNDNELDYLIRKSAATSTNTL